MVLGTDGPDDINAAAGNDIVCALADGDTINGASGDDLIDGGGDADTCTVGPGADIVACATVTDPIP